MTCFTTVSTVLYAINNQHLGILISLGCLGLYFLVEAYFRKIESLCTSDVLSYSAHIF